MKIKKGNVKLELTAEEAGALKALVGILSLLDVQKLFVEYNNSYDRFGDNPHEEAAKSYAVTSKLYDIL